MSHPWPQAVQWAREAEVRKLLPSLALQRTGDATNRKRGTRFHLKISLKTLLSCCFLFLSVMPILDGAVPKRLRAAWILC